MSNSYPRGTAASHAYAALSDAGQAHHDATRAALTPLLSAVKDLRKHGMDLEEAIAGVFDQERDPALCAYAGAQRTACAAVQGAARDAAAALTALTAALAQLEDVDARHRQVLETAPTAVDFVTVAPPGTTAIHTPDAAVPQIAAQFQLTVPALAAKVAAHLALFSDDAPPVAP